MVSLAVATLVAFVVIGLLAGTMTNTNDEINKGL